MAYRDALDAADAWPKPHPLFGKLYNRVTDALSRAAGQATGIVYAATIPKAVESQPPADSRAPVAQAVFDRSVAVMRMVRSKLPSSGAVSRIDTKSEHPDVVFFAGSFVTGSRSASTASVQRPSACMRTMQVVMDMQRARGA